MGRAVADDGPMRLCAHRIAEAGVVDQLTQGGVPFLLRVGDEPVHPGFDNILE